MKESPAKVIRRAREHLRDHAALPSWSTVGATSWPEPCRECEEAHKLLQREQPLVYPLDR